MVYRKDERRWEEADLYSGNEGKRRRKEAELGKAGRSREDAGRRNVVLIL